MPTDVKLTESFRYDGYEIDPSLNQMTCRYSIGTRHFFEQFTFPHGSDWNAPAVDAAARLVFLLAGVSYYKTSAPPVIDLGELLTTPEEREFLRTFHVAGLGEFAHRNGLDLSALEITGPDAEVPPACSPDHDPPPALDRSPSIERPLVPFGGGIDSIVTADTVRRRYPDTALCIVHRSGDRYDAIERPAVTTGLPILRVGREVDPGVVHSVDLGYLNGHVPVTGIISAVAILCAVLDGRDAVIMSNEWSASIGTLMPDGGTINHQWSKSLEFETGFRRLLREAPRHTVTTTPAPASTPAPAPAPAPAAAPAPAPAPADRFLPTYFSMLRPYSELWVAARFAELTQYHEVFRSCNHAFHIDRRKRLDHWCARCDKCCFIDLILAPFLAHAELSTVFGEREPLDNAQLIDRFRALVGTDAAAGQKPFECVGDVDECRAALRMAADRPDRAASATLQQLAAELPAPNEIAESLMQPMGEHWIPDDFAPANQLV